MKLILFVRLIVTSFFIQGCSNSQWMSMNHQKIIHIFLIMWLINIPLILLNDFALGGTLYKCTDKNGKVVLTDNITGENCEPSVRFRDKTKEELLADEKESQAQEARVAAEEEIFQAERRRKLLLNQCIEKVENKHHERWNADCRLYHRRDDCDLPIENAMRLDNLRIAERDQCLRAYPQLPYP